MRHTLGRWLVAGAIASAIVLASCSAPTGAPSAPTSTPSGSTTSATQGSGGAGTADDASLAALIDAADKEGQVVLWGLFPTEQQAPQVEQAFNQRFGTHIHIQVIPVSAPQVNAKIIADAASGRHDWDIVPTQDQGHEAELVQRGLAARVDWAQTFGAALPDVGEAAQVAFPSVAGYGPRMYDATYALVYNTQQTRPEDLPNRWADLADPTYQGKLALTSDGTPFNDLMLSPDWGQTKVETLLKGLAANQPVLQASSLQMVDLVGRGEVPMGIADIAAIWSGQAQGEPVDVHVLDYVPTDPRFTILAQDAPHPNAARLYTAWEVTEGMALFGDLKHTYRLSQPNNPLSQTIAQQNPNASFVAPQSDEDVAASRAFLSIGGAILTGTQ